MYKEAREKDPELSGLETTLGTILVPKGFGKIIKDLKAEEGKVLLEGKRDREALLLFSIDSLTVSEKRAEDLLPALQAEKKLILLFDSDKKGKELTRKFSEFFPKKASRLYMKKLYPYCDGRIENLTHFLHKFV